MRAVKANRIRKGIYGDLSLKEERQYVRINKTGEVVNNGLRVFYQLAKKVIQKREYHGLLYRVSNKLALNEEQRKAA